MTDQMVEIVDTLKGLAADFENLLDLHNMDWMIFTYEQEAPWFYVQEWDMKILPRHNLSEYGDRQKSTLLKWKQEETDKAALRGRFLEAIEALTVAATHLANTGRPLNPPKIGENYRKEGTD